MKKATKIAVTACMLQAHAIELKQHRAYTMEPERNRSISRRFNAYNAFNYIL